MSSIQPWNFAGPLGESYATRIRSTVFPAATVPMREATLFHWLTYSRLASAWPCGVSGPPWLSVAPRSLRYVPSVKARSTETWVAGYERSVSPICG